LALLEAVLLLLAAKLLTEIMLAVAGIAAVVIIKRALAVGGAVTIHGFKVGN
jgi:hypothetical protein